MVARQKLGRLFMVVQNIDKNHEYRKVTDAFFYASLSLIPVFAVPAFAALSLGKFLDAKFETGKMITLGLLLLALVSSWVLTLKKAKQMNAEYRKMREEMKQTQNK